MSKGDGCLWSGSSWSTAHTVPSEWRKVPVLTGWLQATGFTFLRLGLYSFHGDSNHLLL